MPVQPAQHELYASLGFKSASYMSMASNQGVFIKASFGSDILFLNLDFSILESNCIPKAGRVREYCASQD